MALSPIAAPVSRSSPRRGFLYYIKMITGTLLALGVVCLLLGWLLIWTTAQNLPSFQELITKPRGQSVNIRGADGSILAHIGPNYGEWLNSEALPSTIKTAMVAVEDRRFYHHIGVDPVGLSRAMWINIKAHRFVQGGSTITQQVVKNLFLTSEKSVDRKGREIITALALDSKFTKNQILELYLNRVYFGGGAFGIDAASRRFYGHSAREMSLPEAIVIAGLVKAPTRYAPSSDPRQAIARAHVVLATMLDSGAITQEQAQAVRLDALRFAAQPRENNVRYFTDWVLTQVESLTDESQQPIDVLTTLDPVLQKKAESAITRNVPHGLQGGLVSLGYDGSIKALVGGADYVTSSYNRAIYARRQPGSAFKLFVYLAALEAGMTPESTEVDEPVNYGNWSPVNSNHRNVGTVSLTTAFSQSINTVAVKLADKVGFNQVASVARRLGISTPISSLPSMALGSSEVTLLDLTGAYASVARGGSSAKPYAIRQIVRGDGAVLYTYAPGLAEQVITADTAASMTKMMIATIESGTGRAAKLDRPVAGKTGTTSDNRDGWFMGFTGDLTTGVWLGRDDAKSVPGLAGGKLPALTWADYMRAATAGLPVQPLFALSSTAVPTEPDQEAYGLNPPYPQSDNPTSDQPAPSPDEENKADDGNNRLNQDWLDKTLRNSNADGKEADRQI